MDNGPLSNTADLVTKTLDGDRDAFTELVERYRDAACAVAYTYFGSFDDVQDVVQEVFVHSYIHLGQLKDPSKFGPWLRRTTANVCLSRLRKRKREAVSLEEVDGHVSSPADSEGAAVRIIVRNALSSLSENMRLTVTLSYINGYSHSEVAHLLDVPLETVRSRLKHAKRKLREEMIEMVEDVLHKDKPGDELVKRIIATSQLVYKILLPSANEETLEYLRRCDTALAAIRDFSSSEIPEDNKALILNIIETEWHFDNAQDKARILEELKNKSIEDIRIRVEAEVLVAKGIMFLRSGSFEEAKALFEQAMELIRNWDYLELRSDITDRIAYAYYHDIHQHELAADYLRQAIEAAKEVGNVNREAANLRALANIYLFHEHRIAESKSLYIRAYELFHESGESQKAIMNHAMLMLVEEVGERFSSLIRWNAECFAIRQTNGIIEMIDEGGGWRSSPGPGAWSFDVSMLRQFYAISKEIADKSMPPCESWTNREKYVIPGAVNEEITVVSYEDRVSVPAGTFEDCLLLEIVTTEGQLPDKMSDMLKQWTRSYVCGVRRAWFAPGVGLVQLETRNTEGEEATIQLNDYEITQPSSGYFPLAIGNSWTYGWANIPAENTAKDVYRVIANEKDVWYLENYEYAYKS